MDFTSLHRKDLQFLCKKNRLMANTTNAALVKTLQALKTVEGIEELQKMVSKELLSSKVEKQPPIPVPLPRLRRTAAKAPEVTEMETSKEIQEVKSTKAFHANLKVSKGLEDAKMTLKEEVQEICSLKLKSPEPPHAKRRASARISSSGEEAKLNPLPMRHASEAFEEENQDSVMEVKLLDPSQASRGTSAQVVSCRVEPKIQKKKQPQVKALEITDIAAKEEAKESLESQSLKVKSSEPPQANRRTSARVMTSREPLILEQRPSPRKRRSAKALEVVEIAHMEVVQEELKDQPPKAMSNEPHRVSRRTSTRAKDHLSGLPAKALEVVEMVSREPLIQSPKEEIKKSLESHSLKVQSTEPSQANRRTSARVPASREPLILEQKPSPKKLRSAKALEVEEMAYMEIIQEELEDQSPKVMCNEPHRVNRRTSTRAKDHLSGRPVKAVEVLEVASEEETEEPIEIPSERRNSALAAGIVEELKIQPRKKILPKSPVRRKAETRSKKNSKKNDKDEGPEALKIFEMKDETAVGVFTRRSTRLSSRETEDESREKIKGTIEIERQVNVEHRKKKRKEGSFEEVEVSFSKVEVENGDSSDELVEEKEHKDQESQERHDHGLLSSLQGEDEILMSKEEKNEEKDQNDERVEDQVDFKDRDSNFEAEKSNYKALPNEKIEIHGFYSSPQKGSSSLDDENGEGNKNIDEDKEIQILSFTVEEDNSNVDVQNDVPEPSLVEGRGSENQQDGHGSSLILENLESKVDESLKIQENSGKQPSEIEFTEVSAHETPKNELLDDQSLENDLVENLESKVDESFKIQENSGIQQSEIESDEVSADQPENDVVVDSVIVENLESKVDESLKIQENSGKQPSEIEFTEVSADETPKNELLDDQSPENDLVENLESKVDESFKIQENSGIQQSFKIQENSGIQQSEIVSDDVSADQSPENDLVVDSGNQSPQSEFAEVSAGNLDDQLPENKFAEISAYQPPVKELLDGQLPENDLLEDSGNQSPKREFFNLACNMLPANEPVEDSSEKLKHNASCDEFLTYEFVKVSGGESPAKVSGEPFPENVALEDSANQLVGDEHVENEHNASCDEFLTYEFVKVSGGESLPAKVSGDPFPENVAVEDSVNQLVGDEHVENEHTEIFSKPLPVNATLECSNYQFLEEKLEKLFGHLPRNTELEDSCGRLLVVDVSCDQSMELDPANDSSNLLPVNVAMEECSGDQLLGEKDVINSEVKSLGSAFVEVSDNHSSEAVFFSVFPDKVIYSDMPPLTVCTELSASIEINEEEDNMTSKEAEERGNDLPEPITSSPFFLHCAENLAAETVADQDSDISKSQENFREVSGVLLKESNEVEFSEAGEFSGNESIDLSQNSFFKAVLCLESSAADSMAEFLKDPHISNEDPPTEILQASSFDPQVSFFSSEIESKITISESANKLKEILVDHSSKIPNLHPHIINEDVPCEILQGSPLDTQVFFFSSKIESKITILESASKLKEILADHSSKIPNASVEDSLSRAFDCLSLRKLREKYKQKLKETNNLIRELDFQFPDSGEPTANQPVDMRLNTETLQKANLPTTDTADELEETSFDHATDDNLQKLTSKDEPFHVPKKIEAFKSLERLSLRQLREKYKQTLIRTQTELEKNNFMITENCQQRPNDNNLINQEEKNSMITENCQQRLNDNNLINQEKENSVIKLKENRQHNSNEEQAKVEKRLPALKQEDLECLSRRKQNLNEDSIKLERKRTPLKNLNYHSVF